MKPIKVILLPGNGGGSTHTPESFFPYIKEELEKLGISVISPGTYPDSKIGRESVWIPYIESLGTDENTILIGHSTGAIAAMRYAQTHKILGSVLVGAYHTDLGLQDEKEAEYFNTPWDWEKIKQNQQWVIQFHSLTDPFIPLDEAEYVQEHLNTEYHEFTDKGHFYPLSEFPELIEALKNKLI
jgi:predicted alpha/beta hydrolase family esterase